MAVRAFLDGRIGFTQIADTIERVLEKTQRVEATSFEALAHTDERARAIARELIDKEVRC